MNGKGSLERHVALYVAYGTRVAQLRPAAWERLRLRCVDLGGPTFRSLVNRTLLAAKPNNLWVPPIARPTPTMRAIRGVSRLVQTSLAFAFEVAAEFEDSDPHASSSPRPRTRSSGRATSDAFIDASFLIETALAPFERTDRGVTTAVRAAGQAVFRRDWLTDTDFESVYTYVESEIPFADLEPPAG